MEDAREEVQRGGVELALKESDVADGLVGELVLAHGALVSLEQWGSWPVRWCRRSSASSSRVVASSVAAVVL